MNFKKFIFPIILICLCFGIGKSQDYIKLHVENSFANRHYSNDNFSIADNEKPRMLPSFELSYLRKHSDKIEIEFGTGYLMKGYKYKLDDLRWPNQISGGDFDPSTPSGEPNKISEISYFYDYRYISVFLRIRYEIIGGLKVLAGFSPQYLLGNEHSGRHSFNQDIDVGLSYELFSKGRFDFELTALFRSQFFDNIKANYINEKFYNYGLGIDINYKI